VGDAHLLIVIFSFQIMRHPVSMAKTLDFFSYAAGDLAKDLTIARPRQRC